MKPIEHQKTIEMRLLVDGENVIVETPWATSIMSTERVINMVLAYGSLHWKTEPEPAKLHEIGS